ncbi:hypothetical protein F2Q69_00034795 [Brassica cretica]|uniref:Uncharacterized protein n=1 Tax=Brassica cretica TaxID=69181 RepID=A0A8S9SPH3_BRACR|nr:hypothetical protein F2Q69_00034795 [Brassica cretica]
MLSSCWREDPPYGVVGFGIQAKLFYVPGETHEELQYAGGKILATLFVSLALILKKDSTLMPLIRRGLNQSKSVEEIGAVRMLKISGFCSRLLQMLFYITVIKRSQILVLASPCTHQNVPHRSTSCPIPLTFLAYQL